jgi:glutamate synthase (ferredoxin)
MDAGIVIEMGSVWLTHHFAMLMGCGANGVQPYLALETIKQWHGLNRMQSIMKARKLCSQLWMKLSRMTVRLSSMHF